VFNQLSAHLFLDFSPPPVFSLLLTQLACSGEYAEHKLETKIRGKDTIRCYKTIIYGAGTPELQVREPFLNRRFLLAQDRPTAHPPL
jgi:hypothetical protein